MFYPPKSVPLSLNAYTTVQIETLTVPLGLAQPLGHGFTEESRRFLRALKPSAAIRLRESSNPRVRVPPRNPLIRHRVRLFRWVSSPWETAGDTYLYRLRRSRDGPRVCSRWALFPEQFRNVFTDQMVLTVVQAEGM